VHVLGTFGRSTLQKVLEWRLDAAGWAKVIGTLAQLEAAISAGDVAAARGAVGAIRQLGPEGRRASTPVDASVDQSPTSPAPDVVYDTVKRIVHTLDVPSGTPDG
jgi:hypothetical protein